MDGVDIYDPVKNSIEATNAGKVAAWFVDTDYDGKVFCLDDAGTTHILQAGPEFKVLGKNSIPEQIWATPAISGGALFLRGVNNLYCIKQ